MKEVRIFLASSYELEPDRARVGNLIRELNDTCYEERGIHFRLVKWEDLDCFYNPVGKQTEYDFQIRNSELFIGLFWHIAGRHTKHEVEEARKYMQLENVLIFHKTAEFKPDHEGSEDEKRFLERHLDEKLNESREEFEAYLHEQNSAPYADFNSLQKILTEKLAKYCERIHIPEEEKKRFYCTDALQIHVVASPEAEPDFARLGDLVRYLDDNSQCYCRIKLIPEIVSSDMFVSLCHTSAPEPMTQEIHTAIASNSGNSGKPRLYFCMKYVADSEKQESLKTLETKISDTLKHYPDRYYQSAEMKLHFLLQLEHLKHLKHSSGRDMLVVENGTICLQSGENKYPLMSCDDMPSLQKDKVYEELKAEQKRLLNDIKKLQRQDQTSTEDLSKDIFRLNQELAEIRQQIDDRRTGYFRVTRTLEEMVGREQDKEIVEIRELVGKGMIDEARKLLPKDSNEFMQTVTDELNAHAAKMSRLYDVCRLTIECLCAGNLRKNRDEIFKFYELLVKQITPALQDDGKTAEACYYYGNFLAESLHYDKAQEHYEKALTIWKQTLGEDHPYTAISYLDIGKVWGQKGYYDTALGYYEKGLKIWLHVLEENHPGTVQFYISISVALSDKCEYDKALEYCDKALKVQLHFLDENHDDTATCYNNIGGICLAKGDYDKALEYFEKVLAIRLKIFGENHPDAAASYNNIGLVWKEKGDCDTALEYYEKGLKIWLSFMGENHSDTAGFYNDIGGAWQVKGDHDKALEYYEKALAIRLKIFGENHPDAAASYNNIGLVWKEKGDCDTALEYYEKGLKIWLHFLGENHYHTADVYNNIGSAWDAKGDHDKALEYHEKALAIQLKIFGENHPDIADSYHNIGLVWKEKGYYDTALEYYEKGLKIWLHFLGENHFQTACFYNNIGSAWDAKGYHDKALEYYEKALAIRLKIFGENHPDVAKSYNNIGLVWYEKGDYDTALEYCEKGLKIWLHVLGELNSFTAVAYWNIGEVYSHKGAFSKALAYYEKALKIRKSVLGEKHPDTVVCRNKIELVNYELWKDFGVRLTDKQLSDFSMNPDQIANRLLRQAETLEERQEFSKALEVCRKALAIATDAKIIADLYQMTGELHEELGEEQSVIDEDMRAELKACMQALQHENIPSERICRCRRIGALHRELAEPEKALAAYDDAIKIIEECQDTSVLAGTIHNEAGRLRYDDKDFEGALQYCQDALRILRLHYDEHDQPIVKTMEFILKIQEKINADTSHQ